MGEATWLGLALSVIGVADGDTEGGAEVVVATDERFFPFKTNDLRYLTYSNIDSVDQSLHS